MRRPLRSRSRIPALAAAALALGAAPLAAQRPEPLPDVQGESPQGEATRIQPAAGERLLLAVTDRDARATLGEWLKALAPAADSARARRVVVVALPGMVPAAFRGPIRSSFPQAGPTTYVLDWGGEVVARVARERRLPCVLVVGPDTRVAASECGPVEAPRVQALVAALRAPAPGGAATR